MINPAESRFVGGYSPMGNQQILMIADYQWWAENETEILDWMDEHLPRGREHQTGMVITFDTKKELTWFLLRWSA